MRFLNLLIEQFAKQTSTIFLFAYSAHIDILRKKPMHEQKQHNLRIINGLMTSAEYFVIDIAQEK